MTLKQKLFFTAGVFLLLLSLGELFWISKYITPFDPGRGENLRVLAYGVLGGALTMFLGMRLK